MHIESTTKDSIDIWFKLRDDTKQGIFFLFAITAKISGFSHEEEFWVTEDDYKQFIGSLKILNENLLGNSTLLAQNSDSDFSFSLIGDKNNRGYLLARAHFHIGRSGTQRPSTDTLFEGGFFVEPALLPEWIDEFISVLNPSS